MTENLTGATVSDAVSARKHAMRRAAEKRSTRTGAVNMLAGAWVVGLWYWGIVVVIAGVLIYLGTRTDIFEGEPPDGVVNGSVKFFLLVLGIILPVASVAIHVASGGTRRSFVRATWITGGVVGVTFGLAAALLGYVEWFVLDSLGWEAQQEMQNLYADGGQIGTVFLVQLFFCGVYWLAGAAIGMGYYRLKFVRGTLALPVLLLPVVLVELALQSGYFGAPFAQAVGLGEAQVLTAILGGIAALAAAGLALHLVSRSVSISPVTT
ncbi:hypothetical protein [Oerskovia turbata]